MRRLLQDIAPVLHLTRVTTAFAVVANTWFVILWTRAMQPHEGAGAAARLAEGPLWLLLGGGALAAVGLFAFATCLNDVLDLKRDRTMRPDRPLPSGQIRLESTLGVVIGTLTASIIGASVFGMGAVQLTLALIVAIFVFNAAGRFVPAVGLVLFGLIYGGHMLIPNTDLRFLWPVWLVMTHSLIVAGATHWMARKVPRLSRRAVVAAVLGWAFWTGVILTMQWRRADPPRRLWPEWVPAAAGLWTAALAVIFVVVAWDKVRRYGLGSRAAEKVWRYGSLWLALYACAWLVGAGKTHEAGVLVGLTIAGFLGMTVLREAYGFVERPMGYRR